MRTHWFPCRVCEAEHRNPQSSSICPTCGVAESQKRQRAEREAFEAFERSPLGQFMSMPEDERWHWVFEQLNSREDGQ